MNTSGEVGGGVSVLEGTSRSLNLKEEREKHMAFRCVQFGSSTRPVFNDADDSSETHSGLSAMNKTSRAETHVIRSRFNVGMPDTMRASFNLSGNAWPNAGDVVLSRMPSEHSNELDVDDVMPPSGDAQQMDLGDEKMILSTWAGTAFNASSSRISSKLESMNQFKASSRRLSCDSQRLGGSFPISSVSKKAVEEMICERMCTKKDIREVPLPWLDTAVNCLCLLTLIFGAYIMSSRQLELVQGEGIRA